MKRIKVNAQVTFMISVLEMIGYILMITVVVIFKSTALPVIINIEIMYMIILPRAYLMNTSYNKGRIIEHGWKNVFKNTFGLSPDMPNPDGSKENRIIANQDSNTVPKRRLSVSSQYKRYRIHPQTTSHHVSKPPSSGCTSTLKVPNTKKILDCKMEPKIERREMMMIAEKLKGPQQVDRALKNLVSVETEGILEGENVLGCTANNIRKISCSENGDLTITDLEQESEVLFGCK